MSVAPLRHWYESGAELVATTVNVAVCPSLAVASPGGVPIRGGSGCTVRVAEPLVTEPAAFETTTEKRAPSSAKAVAAMV